MISRIVVALIGVPILLGCFCFAPSYASAILLCLFCIIGTYELSICVFSKKRGKKWWILPAAIGTFFLLYQYFRQVDIQNSQTISRILMLSYIVLFFILCLTLILEHGKENAIDFKEICVCIFAGIIIPYSFSTLLSLRLMTYGEGFILIPIIAAFCSDAGAFFVGRKFGRNKLIERVSPNKTKEGAVGGIFGAVVGMVIFRIVFFLITEVALNILWCIVIGVIGSVFGQIGDLFFSTIKREYKIKDFGKLLPGHGGILDRFDSVLFVSPCIYILLMNGIQLY